MKRERVNQLFFFLPLLFLASLTIPHKSHAHALSAKTVALINCAIPALIGFLFLALAVLKFHGRQKGVVGGGDKPFSDRCRGACPTWSSRTNRCIQYSLVILGLVFLSLSLMEFLHLP